MKSLFVSRKTYEIAQQNYKICFEEKNAVSKKNVELQKKIKELEELLTLYKGTQKDAKRCETCNSLFIPKMKSQKNCKKCIDKKKEGNNGRE